MTSSIPEGRRMAREGWNVRLSRPTSDLVLASPIGYRPRKYDFSVHKAPHVFGRERHMMRPFALEIAPGDFAFAVSHRLAAFR
jgi:hypothetical protein